MRIMTSLLTILLSIYLNAQANPIEVGFKKNIEFLGYIVELGDPSNNDPNHPISIEINKFPEDRTNKKLNELFGLAGNIDYSTLINLMYFLPEFPLDNSYLLSEDRAIQLGFDTEDEIATIRNLVHQINAFYKQSHFDSVWENLSMQREETLTELRQLMPSRALFENMENFYGISFEQYEIVPSLTLWSAGWGIKDKYRNRATFILGPMAENYDFGNRQNFVNLAIHEYGHSFVNPVVLENTIELTKTKSLFGPIKSDMVVQGYSNWETCMIEHFVRSSEVIMNEFIGNNEGVKALLEDYGKNRKFIYLQFIVGKLKEYRLEKKLSYPDSVRKTIEDLELAYLRE